MKNLMSSTILSLLCLLLFAGIYPLVITGVANFAPNNGKGDVFVKDGKIRGFKNIGQNFSSEMYFWGRPSAVNYNAAGSCGSNKGPSNPDYLLEVKNRVDSFLVHHPYLKESEIPSEMVTASGSGLDPNISPQSAIIQVKRVAKERNMSEQKLLNFVNNNIEKPFWGIMGPSVVNVLKLNIALDCLK